MEFSGTGRCLGTEVSIRVEDSVSLVRKSALSIVKPCRQAVPTYSSQGVQLRLDTSAGSLRPNWISGYELYDPAYSIFTTSILYKPDLSLLHILSAGKNFLMSIAPETPNSLSFDSGEAAAIVAIRTSSSGKVQAPVVLARSDSLIYLGTNGVRYTTDDSIILQGWTNENLIINGVNPIPAGTHAISFLAKVRGVLPL
jgi:hypothetical protein